MAYITFARIIESLDLHLYKTVDSDGVVTSPLVTVRFHEQIFWD